MELACQGERLSTPSGNQNLESLVTRQIAEQAGVVVVIFDNQQNGVALLQVCTIILNGLDAVFGCGRGNQLRSLNGSSSQFQEIDTRRRPHIGLRQIQSKSAALSHLAAQLDFPAEETGQL